MGLLDTTMAIVEVLVACSWLYAKPHFLLSSILSMDSWSGPSNLDRSWSSSDGLVIHILR
jgi:hypothetical protein